MPQVVFRHITVCVFTAPAYPKSCYRIRIDPVIVFFISVAIKLRQDSLAGRRRGDSLGSCLKVLINLVWAQNIRNFFSCLNLVVVLDI